MKSGRRKRRFFSSARIPGPGKEAWLDSDETKHIRTILRYSEGDQILLVDGSGCEATAEILSFSPDQKTCVKIISSDTLDASCEGLSLSLYPAIPKKGKMDYLVEKAQELGVRRLCPVMTQRTEIRLSAENRSKKADKWDKIAREAAKQSGARFLLKVEDPLPLEKVIKRIDDKGPVIVFHPCDDARNFRDWIERDLPGLSGRELSLFIGPEGGFSDREIEVLSQSCRENARPFYLVSLGDAILKADTAFVAVCGTLRLLQS